MQPTPDYRSVAEAISTIDRFIQINQQKIESARRLIDECRYDRYDETTGESGEIVAHYGPSVCEAVAGMLSAFCSEWQMLIEQQSQYREEMARLHAHLSSGIVIPQTHVKKN